MSDNNDITSRDSENITQAVLEIVRDLILELDPEGLSSVSVHLDSDLDRDLCLDSLTRAELLTRIESRFDVSLPEHALSNVATPEDIVGAILTAVPSSKAGLLSESANEIKLDSVNKLPTEVKTLQALLDWHVEHHPERPHLYVYQNADEVVEVNYRKLKEQALKISAGLIDSGVEAGDCVAIMLPTCTDYFYSFFGEII